MNKEQAELIRALIKLNADPRDVDLVRFTKYMKITFAEAKIRLADIRQELYHRNDTIMRH